MPRITTNVMADVLRQQQVLRQTSRRYLTHSRILKRGFIHMPLRWKSMHIKKGRKKMNGRRVRDTQPVV